MKRTMIVVLALAFAASAIAQDGGGGGRGQGGGRRGGGGRMGGGGRRGGGGQFKGGQSTQGGQLGGFSGGWSGRSAGGMQVGGQRTQRETLLTLANRADVQRDLKITDEQKTKLSELQTKVQEGMRAMFENMRNQGGGATTVATPPAGAPPTAAPGGDVKMSFTQGAVGSGGPGLDPSMRDAMRKRNEEALKGILNEKQMRRLHEIDLQLRGVKAILDQDVQAKLGVTALQVKQFANLQKKLDAANAKVQEHMRDPEHYNVQLLQGIPAKNAKVFETELKKLLSIRQKNLFASMTGKPFKADPIQPQGMPGGMPGAMPGATSSGGPVIIGGDGGASRIEIAGGGG